MRCAPFFRFPEKKLELWSHTVKPERRRPQRAKMAKP